MGERRKERMDDRRKRKRTWNLTFAAAVAAVMLVAGGCANFKTERGVENRWRATDTPVFESGSTTQSDVMKALGPPSQIITLPGGSVFYYLREQGAGKGLILLIYNEVRYTAEYDRAIFFFDEKGVLTDYSYSEFSPPSVKIGEK
jgi:hypothetical protein